MYGCAKHTQPWLITQSVVGVYDEPIELSDRSHWLPGSTKLCGTLISVRHPFAWMHSMSNAPYQVTCGNHKQLARCRFNASLPNAMPWHVKCAGPAVDEREFEGLEDLWVAYYDGYRTWARDEAYYPLVAERSEKFRIARNVMFTKHEDLLMRPALMTELIRNFSGHAAEATGEFELIEKPTKKLTWGRYAGFLLNYTQEAAFELSRGYCAFLPKSVITRAQKNPAVRRLAASFNYSLECPDK